MAVDKVSCREIAKSQEFRNLGHWSWIFLRGKNNIITRIITEYISIVNASSGGVYSQQPEPIAIMKI